MKKKMTFVNSIALVAMLGLALALSGCETSPEPGVTSQWGVLHTNLNGSPTQIINAANKSLKGMDLIIISSNASQFDGKVIARTSDDKPVTVSAHRKDAKTSDVTIDVSSENSQSLGLSLLHSIRKQLPKK